eukprot:CAMPEP_0197315192 /NCGR_PEP_ID=MMETSP0891-20130614/37150_1 /TAXON_ID=44058 ORGANISM="Aureoumbra lagunensis, Strain CCMP1510" /NCGR_SAMPLE_ID=MMETSP0891 /ASSEMBLY_ACC=CAM_ASM_000534 /LENGTH=1066 /DNA_ID=CAMNT_0042804029 /DNA_START=460 /DNA_END=3660 /DNA_ORIENTATION=+
MKRESRPISFIWAISCGLSCSIFVDHGDSFMIADPDGEKPAVRIIESISCEDQGGLVRFTVPDGIPATSLDPRSSYLISDISKRSRAQVLNNTLWPYFKLDGDPANALRIGNTSFLGTSVDDINRLVLSCGGIITETKTARTVRFQSLAQALTGGNEFVMTDYSFGMKEQQLHAALIGILEFDAANGRLPKPNDEADADVVVANARLFAQACRVLNQATGSNTALCLTEDQIDETIIRAYARHCVIELQPIACFCGGVAAQEVVKCSGKYTPIPGFAHFSFQEALPNPPPPLAERQPQNSRYDELIAVYGSSFVLQKLANLNYFLIGSGALGCEFVKNFALCGICCGPNGKLTIADADRIELSNLSRQFLFREHNVRQSKAVAAAAMALNPGPRTVANPMNTHLKVQAIEAYVGPKTETPALFWDPFWENLDGICNALDNMEARFYVDAQCVKFEKPLLESGTMGTSGNIDPIVPNKTRTYRQGGNAADQAGVPMCTLRNFPHLTDHCVEWARDKFAELFVKPARRAMKFAADPNTTITEFKQRAAQAQHGADLTSLATEAEALASTLRLAAEPDSLRKRHACAQAAFNAFHALFRDQILDLIHAYPIDARVKDVAGRDKGAFWSGHKRFPTAATYDPNNSAHWQFLVATTHLLSQMVGGQPRKEEEDEEYASQERSQGFAADLVASLSMPIYARRAVDTSDIEGTTSSSNTDDEDAYSRQLLNAAIQTMETLATNPPTDIQPEDFEKDDDYNFHVDFVAACANCRALNYAIPLTDHDKAKQTAGRIVPAIATTTAAVTGLVMLELFKVVLDMPNTALRTRQVGLGVNVYPSFDADNLIEHRTTETMIRPDPSTLPEEAFEANGSVKREFWTKHTSVAYPNPHSVWTKLPAPEEAALHWKVTDLADWLSNEHGLKLTAWNLQCGVATDEDGKPRPISTRVYPPIEQLDLNKLPDLTLSKPKAMMYLQQTHGLRGSSMMKYLAEWDKYRKIGHLPENFPPPEKSTAEMTLIEILQIKGNLDLTGRKRVLLDGLSCSIAPAKPDDTDSMDVDEVDVEKLAPVLLKLPG